MIEKNIWTYWHEVNIPDIYLKIINNNWKIHCPDYTITVLNDTLFKHLTNIDVETLNISKYNNQRKTDIISLAILYYHGGVYMDISMLLNQSLNWITNTDKEFVGYNSPIQEIIIDSWFYAAPKGSEFIKDNIDEFMYMLSFNKDTDYLNEVLPRYPEISGDIRIMLPYLVCQICSYVVKTRKKYNIGLMTTLDSNGPYYYIAGTNKRAMEWDYAQGIRNLMNTNLYDTPIVKLNGSSRRYLFKGTECLLNKYNGIFEEYCT